MTLELTLDRIDRRITLIQWLVAANIVLTFGLLVRLYANCGPT